MQPLPPSPALIRIVASSMNKRVSSNGASEKREAQTHDVWTINLLSISREWRNYFPSVSLSPFAQPVWNSG